jgi:hypothetical protein
VKHVHFIFAVLIAATITMGTGLAHAGGYTFLGSAWSYNTYNNDVNFLAPSSDVKNKNVFFRSESAWLDNVFVCKTAGGSTTLSPGVGQADPGSKLFPAPVVVPVTTDDCTKSGGSGNCTETAVYVSIITDATPEVCAQTPFPTDQYQCFQYLVGLEPDPKLTCQNSQGTLHEVRTKNVCTLLSAHKCDSPNFESDPSCSTEASQFVNYTFPTFNQTVGDTFTASTSPAAVAFCQTQFQP